MTTKSIDQIDQHIARFTATVLHQALLEGTARFWRRRAEEFATVGTPDCDQIAQACHHHADLITTTGLDAAAEDTLAALAHFISTAPERAA